MLSPWLTCRAGHEHPHPHKVWSGPPIDLSTQKEQLAVQNVWEVYTLDVHGFYSDASRVGVLDRWPVPGPPAHRPCEDPSVLSPHHSPREPSYSSARGNTAPNLPWELARGGGQ